MMAQTQLGLSGGDSEVVRECALGRLYLTGTELKV